MAQQFDKHTILIVDDEEKLREILRLYLEAPNREILEAGNGQEALEVIGKNKVDIVITDILMPIMDGLELTRKIVALDPDIPVLIVTAHAGKEETLAALRAGVFEFIAKPFQEDFVCNRVNKALERRFIRLAEKEMFEVLVRELSISGNVNFSQLTYIDRIKLLKQVTNVLLLRLSRLEDKKDNQKS